MGSNPSQSNFLYGIEKIWLEMNIYYIYYVSCQILHYHIHYILYYLYIIFLILYYTYVICMLLTTVRFSETVIESWRDWDFNPRPLISIEML